MAPPFVFPSSFRGLEQDHGDSSLLVRNPISVASMSSGPLEEFVKGVIFDLSDKELFCVEEQDVFDRVYSVVKDFSFLSPASKTNFVESLRSNLSVLLPSIDSLSRASSSSPGADGNNFSNHVGSHRNALKIYTFFLLTITVTEQPGSSPSDNSVKSASKVRKKNTGSLWNWESKMDRILNLIASSLEMNLTLIFGSSNLDENYLSFISRCAFSMVENPIMLRDQERKMALCRIIAICATKYHYTTQTCASILHLLHKFDFVVTPMADAVAVAANKYGSGSLAISLVRDIGRTSAKDYARDTVGAENVGRFLVELSDRVPKIISMNIGILVPHFGGESYKIRNALVGVLGKLVMKAFIDVEGDISSKAVRLRSKQAMLEILLERCKDISAYTRSRVLQVWAELCEHYSVPIGLWNEVATLTAGRLEDKSAIVRKSALNLLVIMLQHNPFGPQLRIASFEATLGKYKEKLLAMEADSRSSITTVDDVMSDKEASQVHNEVDPVSRPNELEPSKSPSASCSCSFEEVSKHSSIVDFGNLEETRALVASLEAGLRFSKCISSIMPVLVQLLASSSVSDVENAIYLLMRCKQFQIDGSDACLRKMLPLVFSQDKSISEAVESAFITIYIKKQPPETARSLLELAIDSNIGDLEALEFIIDSLVLKGEISPSTISSLWDFFSFNVSGITAQQSRGALSILCMAARSSPGILGTHLQDIVDIGFGRWAKEEPLLARTACLALERLCETDKKKLLLNSSTRVFNALQSLLTGFGFPENIWYAASSKAIDAIYTLHPAPESLASELVKNSFSSLFDSSEGDSGNSGSNDSWLSTVNATKLSRFLFIISHIALSQMVYIESCIRKIQKQKLGKERSVAEELNDEKSENSKKENSINAELGLGASEDAVLDTLSERAEKEIISGGYAQKNLLGHCAPFVSKLCRNIAMTEKFPGLHASAMLALCRLMIIDAAFCDENLQLLFTVAERSSSEIVRSNCIIALGDLVIRFPNLLEPWTENVYARLHDPSVGVRKNAVLVLSHLILNDMMKVKGHINEMALRLEDEDERISSLVILFFHELSKKGSNPIYNLLPDILGRLCNQSIKEQSLYNIMQFLIGSIKKDKQMDALVEKLCNRFGGVTDSKQCEYIAYSLSQLTFTEKGIKKLMESFKSYEHALFQDSVVEHIRSIINKSKKFAKPDLKTIIEEFEQKLDKHHVERKEQEEIIRNAQAHQQKVATLSDHCGKCNDKEDLKDESGELVDPIVEASISEVKTNGPGPDAAKEIDGNQIDGFDAAEKKLTSPIFDNFASSMKDATSHSHMELSVVTEESACEIMIGSEDDAKDTEIQSARRGNPKSKAKRSNLCRVIPVKRVTRSSKSRESMPSNGIRRN